MNDRRVVRITGRGLPLPGDDIDTDRIIPARFLKAITFEGLEAHLFEDDRAAGGHPLDDPRFAGATVLVVGRNFGCGSSREHAPQAIARHGFRAIVGESFSEIFFGNSLALGMPCVSLARPSLQELRARIERDPATEIVVDLERLAIEAGGDSAAAQIPPAARQALMSGAWDATGLLRERPEDIEAVARRLPYIRGFET